MHRPGCHLKRTRAIPPRSHLGTIGLLSFRAAAQPVKASPNTTSFRAERVAPTASMHRGRCSRLPSLPTCDSIVTQTREMIASCEAPRLPIGTKERSLDASALHPTCQTKSHRGARIFPSDQHAPGHVRPGFGSIDDSLESPPRHGKTLHTSMGWLEKALGKPPWHTILTHRGAWAGSQLVPLIIG
ncbi:hypothetical protein RIF29_02118 [Crotalaria pallida]|uniref:Uncharacterized protein n=1 Tax=Crotalaria pallida TaxID=3830 RepID=A0AAN9P7U6_CROPI